MKRAVLLGLVVLAIGSASAADQESHREAAARVLESSQARRSLEQIKTMFEGMLTQQMASLDLPAEAEPAVAEMRAEMTALISDLLEWEEMSEFMMTTWVEVFSEEELHQLADFYESELGGKLIERQPEIMQRSMQWAQQKIQERMPVFLEQVEQSRQELLDRYEIVDSPED